MCKGEISGVEGLKQKRNRAVISRGRSNREGATSCTLPAGRRERQPLRGRETRDAKHAQVPEPSERLGGPAGNRTPSGLPTCKCTSTKKRSLRPTGANVDPPHRKQRPRSDGSTQSRSRGGKGRGWTRRRDRKVGGRGDGSRHGQWQDVTLVTTSRKDL